MESERDIGARRDIARSVSLCRGVLLFVSLMATACSICAAAERVWPLLDERTSLSSEDEAALLDEWKVAKESGLLARREEVLRRVSSEPEYFRSRYCRFNNSAVLDMVAELYRIEYDHWKQWTAREGPIERKPYEEASCAQEVELRSEDDEFELYYTDWVNGVALSTLSLEIIDIAVSGFCILPQEQILYLSAVAPEAYVEALLDARVEARGQSVFLAFDFQGDCLKDVLSGLLQLDGILADHPEIRVRNARKIGVFAATVGKDCIRGDAAKTELSPRRQEILERLERLSAECR